MGAFPRAFAATLLLSGQFFLGTAAAAGGGIPLVSLDRDRLAAAGRQAAVLTVAEAGRFAVIATSAQGVALQVVDRMAGPGEIAGAAGERDGRVDLLLDRGSYRIATSGPEKGAGEVRLAVLPFRELNGPRPPRLVELKPVRDTLADLEQRSWWLDLRDQRQVILEAAGRNLADLRLWKDGGWLVDAAPARETIEPVVGRPLRACRIVTVLEPGLYLLTAYGGPDEPWAAGGAEHPFHLRYGIPTLGDAGRRRYIVGPFGADHFIVPGSANYLRIELPEAAAASLEERPFADNANPFGPERSAAAITKKSREPFAQLELAPGGTAPRLVTVRAPAGQAYLLQHFELREFYGFRRSGRYWLSSVHSGHPQDSVDATAFVIRTDGSGQRHLMPSLMQAIEVGADRGWARRCNLLEPLSVLLQVKETGSYEILARGAEARARIVPLFVSRPRDFREPPWQGNGSVWKLDTGYYELQAEPVQPGIAELAIRPQGRLDRIWDLLDKDRPLKGEPVRSAVIFPAVPLDWLHGYEMRFGRQPGVRTGLILRPLPVEIAQSSLPLAHRPQEEIAVPVTVAEAGLLRAETDAGALLEIAVDGRPWSKEATLIPGERAVRVRNPGTATVLSSLWFEPTRLQVDTPLPPLPETALAPPSAFPLLTVREPLFFDLARGGASTYTIHAHEPAFYLLESTGLLTTAGNVRTRLIPTLARDAGSGTGRNFAIGEYLREGEYQLTVTAQGASRGHLGLRLRRAPVRDGGPLREGVPARVTLAPGEGVSHEFEIAAAGEYRLQSSALGRLVPCRLEDADSWPIERPGIPADLTRRFEPGRYRLILLPEPVGSRRVTVFSRIVPPPKREGHGPHPLPLELRVGHRWLESPEGAERVPDRWEFTLPARAEILVELTGEMQGEIRRRDGGTETATVRVPPGRGWTGTLDAGSYTFETVCSRRSNEVDYEIVLRVKELVAGLSRGVNVPATLQVCVGRDGLYQFATTGPADVRARLLSADGATLAEQEDRPDDWNIQMLQRLATGTYRIALEPAGTTATTTTVAMRAVEETVPEATVTLPLRREVRPGDDVLLLPLDLPAGARLLLVRTGAAETTGIAVEHIAGEAWESLWAGIGRENAVEIPLPTAGEDRRTPRYRLRIWSLDRRGTPVLVSAEAVVPRRVSERDLEKGIDLAREKNVPAAPIVLAEAVLERPGVFAVAGDLRWRASGVELQPLLPPMDGRIAAPGTRLLFAIEMPLETSTVKLRASRTALSPGGSVSLMVPPGGIPLSHDLDDKGADALLAIASGISGQPCALLIDRDDIGKAKPGALAAAVFEHGSAAVLLGRREAVALLWQAGKERQPAIIQVRLFAFSTGAAETLPPGLFSGAVAGGTAQSYRLSGDFARLRLALGAGLVAALAEGNRVLSAHGAADRPVDETSESGADRLIVMNSGPSSASWSIEVMPLGKKGGTEAIAAGAPFLARQMTAGTTRIPVAADDVRDKPGTLHVRGAEGGPLLLGTEGRIARGIDLPLGAGGTLLIPHGAGGIQAWVDRPGEAIPGLWGGKPPAEKRDLSPPQTFALSGSSINLRLKSAQPAVFHLRTEAPVITVVQRPGGAPVADLHPAGARLDLPLPAGPSEIWLRAAEGGDLRGRAEATTSTILPVGDGLGPEVLLAPGAARFFSFAVEREGPVGIGVRALPDTVECLTLDASGRTVASGVVQMPKLVPGTYLIALRAPGRGGPVKARPALAGLVPPGLGPPDEVVRQYLKIDSSTDETERGPMREREREEGD